MKLTRPWLLRIVAALGVFIIVYSIFRQVTGIGFGEVFEKNMFDTIIFIALGLFVYNRKLASDEKKEREAAKFVQTEPPSPELAPQEQNVTEQTGTEKDAQGPKPGEGP
jgi:hypothetical protein